MNDASIRVPAAWSELDLDALAGVLLVVGAPDTGKSTLVRWLAERLRQRDRPIAVLDGDVGQSSLGPPATVTLALPAQGSQDLVHWFVGDVSPRGHMLPLVVGAGRLTRRAREAGAETVIVDTTGLVDRSKGGVALKQALMDQLQPTTLFALQRKRELEPILRPWRLHPNVQVIELPVSDAIRRRDTEARQAHRAQAFRRYFAEARMLRLSLRGRGLFDGQAMAPDRLLALQDPEGFALALGLVVRHDEGQAALQVRTPWAKADAVASLRLGAIGVDVDTGRDFRPGRRSR